LDGVDRRSRCIGGGKAVDGAIDIKRGGDNRDDLDTSDATFTWAGRDVDPASGVSGIANGYFNVSIQQVLYHAQDGMSKGLSEEELEGSVFDDVGVNFEWHTADLHG
jgi:hypothetical protein